MRTLELLSDFLQSDLRATLAFGRRREGAGRVFRDTALGR